MKRKLRLTHHLPALLVCLLPLSALAGTIEIEAGKMTLLHKQSRVEFFDNVHLVRDGMQLNCDHLVAHYSEHQLTHADADGHVVISQEQMRGHSQRARLDQRNGILTLTGQAVLEQQGNRVEGESIVHNLNTQHTVVAPGSGGRIHMTIESEGSDTLLPGTTAE